MKVLGVDPGLTGTGFAMLEAQKGEIKLRIHGILRSSEMGWENRVLDLANRVGELARQEELEGIFCELPAYWGTFKQQMWAAQGSLVKQAVLVGAVLAQPGCKVVLVPVNDWKGQMNKEIVEARVQECLGEKQSRSLRSHAVDACGIALWGLKHLGITTGW